MTKGKKCHISAEDFDFCEAMDKAMADNSVNDRSKGFYVSEVTNLETHKTHIRGVSYRYSKKSSPILLNWCPWCGNVLRTDLLEAEKPLTQEVV
jgi:hypothetical protein